MTGYLVLAAVLLVALVAGWLSWTAERLDRMHHRIDLGRAALDAALLRRSAVVLELAASGWPDPARALLLLDAGHAAREAEAADREVAESQLSQALRAVLDDREEVRNGLAEPGVGELLAALTRDCHKVELARRFHNDLVAIGGQLRKRRRVRWFRLAGHAEPPRPVDLDDQSPSGLPPETGAAGVGPGS